VDPGGGDVDPGGGDVDPGGGDVAAAIGTVDAASRRDRTRRENDTDTFDTQHVPALLLHDDVERVPEGFAVLEHLGTLA